MSRSIYAAKIPLRTAYLQIANRLTKPSRHVSMLNRYGINVVLDVGANQGQYARRLIRGGYRGRIISFEPLPSALVKLRLNSIGFARWKVVPIALGNENEIATLNVAGNSQSSSLLPMTDRCIDAGKNVAYVDSIDVPVRRLDDVVHEHCETTDRIFLKMDVQGLEHQVIAGADQCMDQIVGMQLEVSMCDLYDGAPLWNESIELAQQLGFVSTSISSGYCEETTGVMLQADCTFVRDSVAQALRTNRSTNKPKLLVKS